MTQNRVEWRCFVEALCSLQEPFEDANNDDCVGG